MTTQHPTLEARGLVVAYDGKVVVDGVDLALPEGSFTVILGPNASGKSTVLRALARVLKPESGDVLFDGRALSEYGSKELARRMGLLPQDAIAPEGMRVADLVSRGRYPHHSALQRWTSADDAATREALAATNTTDLAERYVDQLSGGQRQRVWVALLLAQQTPVMLLDEPTTFLDIAHQYELLDLLRALNQQGKTGDRRAARPQPGRSLRRQPRAHEGGPRCRQRQPLRADHGGAGRRGLRHRRDRDSGPRDQDPHGDSSVTSPSAPTVTVEG